MTERSIVPDCKSGAFGLRGFESLSTQNEQGKGSGKREFSRGGRIETEGFQRAKRCSNPSPPKIKYLMRGNDFFLTHNFLRNLNQMNLRALLPKQTIFCDYISGLAKLQREMALNFHVLAHSFKDFEEHAQKAQDLEHRADDKTHEIVHELNQTFIIPFDREDIYKLAQELDDVVDLMENVISNIFVYGIKTQEPALVDFADLIKEASQTLLDLSACLRELKYTSRVLELKKKMHDLETEGDKVFRKTISEFFANGQNPLRVIKWKDILEDLERVMDKYQEVGDTIEGIIVKFH